MLEYGNLWLLPSIFQKEVAFMKNKSIDEFAEELRGRRLAFSENSLLFFIIIPIITVTICIAGGSDKLIWSAILGFMTAVVFCVFWFLSINIGLRASVVDGFESGVAKELTVRNWFGFELARLRDVKVSDTYTVGEYEFAVIWLREFEVVAFIS